jgi:uncharacterized protein with GYD domain
LNQTFHTDPTYLRSIYDGLSAGSINKDNATALPIGLVGIYEEVLPPESNVNERKRFMEFFGVWALLKKEVSVEFVMLLLEGWSEEEVVNYIDRYSKWFNSPVSGKYVLYHERFRNFLLQKISHHYFREINRLIIEKSQDANEAKQGDDWERYALEHLSTHLLIAAMETGHGDDLKALAYNTSHWNRQVEISKGFEWSKSLLNDMMLWASKYDDDEVIECALNKVDLYHLEQNDAPRIVELVAQNDLETALNRIEEFGGNDKEGLQRKFILYMLCLMELTLLESKDKPFRKEGIEKLLKHLDDNLPVDHSVLNWNDFFPSYLMFQMACECSKLKVDYINVFYRTNKLSSNLIFEIGLFNDFECEVLLACSDCISDEISKRGLLREISIKLAKQGKIKRSLECLNDIADDYAKCNSLLAVSAELAKQFKIDDAGIVMQEALKCARFIKEEYDKSDSIKNISIELSKQGKQTEAFLAIQEAYVCANEINNEIDKSVVLMEISIELASKGEIEEALACSTFISEYFYKSLSLISISTELAKQGEFDKSKSVIQEAFEYVENIRVENKKYEALKAISLELIKQGKKEEAIETARSIKIDWRSNEAIRFISLELLRQGKIYDSLSVIQEALKLARNISNENSRYFALKAISIILTKLGKIGDAELVINEALESVRRINDENIKSSGLREIANLFSDIGKVNEAAFALQEAFETSYLISDCNLKCQEMRFFSTALHGLKLEEKARVSMDAAIQCALEINIEKDKKNALNEIILELVKQRNFEKSVHLIEEALKYVQDINADFKNAEDLRYISTELIKLGKIKDAIACSDFISDEISKRGLLREISIELAKQGKIKRSLECLNDIADDYAKCNSLLAVSAELAKQFKIDDAGIVMQEALKCARFIKEEYDKSDSIKNISIELSKQGKQTEAFLAIQEAYVCANEINNEIDKSVVLMEISIELASKGEIEEALACSTFISEYFYKSLSLISISTELAKQGEFDKSKSVIQEAFEYVENIRVENKKYEALKAISLELIKQGKKEEAIETARSIKIDWRSNEAIRFISLELLRQGKIYDSLSVIQEALKLARNISNENSRYFALKAISIILTKLGKIGDAELVINEALESVRRINDENIKSSGLREIAIFYIQHRNWKLAEEIVLEISVISVRHSLCFEIAQIENDICKLNNSTLPPIVFVDSELSKFYLKGLAKTVTAIECDFNFLLLVRNYYRDDMNSFAKLLKKYALNILFFNDSSLETIQRFNRTLNIQWAIDIKNSTRINKI